MDLQFLREIFREGWQWASEQMIKFWWRSGSRIQIRIQILIMTLVRHVLVEVCTAPVLLLMTLTVGCVMNKTCNNHALKLNC